MTGQVERVKWGTTRHLGMRVVGYTSPYLPHVSVTALLMIRW